MKWSYSPDEKFMKFPRSYGNSVWKLILVISDLHLSAGSIVHGKRNLLEDFHSDQELIDFFNFYGGSDQVSEEIELIINGDFLDFLAVPYVPFYDDEFWSEKASLEKLRLIRNAHREVFKALDDFLLNPKCKLTYIVGNHDAEMILPRIKQEFLSYFSHSNKIQILDHEEAYNPSIGIYIKHGHQYEYAHKFNPAESVLKSKKDELYLIPSWGSYYVTQVINKFKHERSYVNSIRPVKHFLIHGFLFDTLFILRFIFANAYYFFMVRIWMLIKNRSSWSALFDQVKTELKLFQNYEDLTREFFAEKQDARVLVVGHTHEAVYRSFADGTCFINTGTWTKMTNLDFSQFRAGRRLTFAKIQVAKSTYDVEKWNEYCDVDLYEWRGRYDLPYAEYY